ncbi:hypothetical protein QFC22_001380 [Naganishia vaughanmartiniae]|uniref:Uncharacterized protein n=1 Tax=Naganishia vaughanmartiniae TaxID=1424756 RepID=A0ACC2XGX5_9TREE|nr:hypothetical protein QFC22_001380 [Naganishia vaughanmartiniae]
MAPSQSHSKKSKKGIPLPTQSATTSSASSSTSSTSTSTNEASDVRPSPASSASSFSLSTPSTPPDSSSPMTEITVTPDVVSTYQSTSMAPDFGNLNFTGSGPFPALTNSRHSVDPHGLSRYLMNPEDPILEYMYPVPMRPKVTVPVPSISEGTSSSPPQSKSRQSSFSLFGKKASHVSSPLVRSPVLDAQNVVDAPPAEGTPESSSSETIHHRPLDAPQSFDAHKDVDEPTSSKQELGILQASTSSERSVSARATNGEKTSVNNAKPVAMSSRSMSSDSLDKRMASSQTSLVSTSTETTDGMTTPVVEHESLPPILHVATGYEHGEFVGPMLDTSKERTPTATTKRPGLISGTWKTWLGVNKADKVKKEKLQVKKPKNLRPAPEISTALSADPLSGTLPGSIPPSASTLVEEELHIPEQISPRELECIKTIHRMTLDKLHAIRAVNGSHPAAVDVVDKISYQRNLLLNPAIAQLQSPRSSSPIIDLGSCIFPQQDIFEIDVQLISILRKLDTRQFNDAQIQEIKHLKMTALQSRREKQKRWLQLARSRSDDQSGIGIARFVGRPCFEDRMIEYGSDMQPRQVRTARKLGMWEPEFTKQTEGWVELAQQNLLKRFERLSRYPSPRRSTSGLQSHASSDNLASTTTVSPKRPRDAGARDTRQSPPRKTLARPPSTLNLWAPTRREDRRQGVSDAEDDDTEEEDSDESELDDVPLSTFRNSSRPASKVYPPATDRSSHYSQTLSRPPSMMMPVTTPQPLNGPNVTPAAQLSQSKRGSSQDLVKYRDEYLKVRNRIEKARSGDTERERMSQAIRERTKSTSQAQGPPAGTQARRESSKDLRIDTANEAPKAGSLSAPSSPRRHSRNPSYSSAMPSATHAANKSSRPAINSRQTALGISDARLSQFQYAGGNGLARRSMSHADVANAGNYMYGMPNMGQQVMFVPVPMMPFAPMVNPFGMPMQANAQQMMMQQQQQMMHQQHHQQQQSRPRRQSTMELSTIANSGQQQHERSTLPRGGRGRTEGREPVR